MASSSGALSVNFLLCTNQECRGEAGLGSRGKEQGVGLLLRHLRGEQRHNSQATVWRSILRRVHLFGMVAPPCVYA